MKLNNYFELEEFVNPETFRTHKELSIRFLDPRIIDIATAYREYFKVPVIVNTWHVGGDLSNRGLRSLNSTVGARLSQHKFGRAFDCHLQGLKTEDVYNEIIKEYEHFKQFGLTTLEDINFTPAWIHSDCRWTNSNQLLIVKP